MQAKTDWHVGQQITINEVFRKSLARVPDKVFLDFAGRKFTFREFDERCNALVHGLVGLGLGKGKTVVTLMDNALEGVLLFVILWGYANRHRPMGAVSGLFLLGYGTMRFIAEFAREPDNFLGYLTGGLTMGQWLSLPMIGAGFLMMVWAYRRAGKAEPTLLDRLK